MNDLCKDNVPNPNDRAYFSLDTGLRNPIFMAKQALQLSCLDQENARLKIEKWKDLDPESQHFFRPFLEEIVKSNPMIDKAPITSVDEANGKFRGNDGVVTQVQLWTTTGTNKHFCGYTRQSGRKI